MAAVMTTERPGYGYRIGPTTVPVRPHPESRARVPAAAYRRRRLAAILLGFGLVVVAGRAGAALGGSPLAAPERRPPVVSYQVKPGDSLWTVATRLVPHSDPRPVVDALSRARHDAPLLPGETIVWQR